jgi:PAS domain S-box-containing protein
MASAIFRYGLSVISVAISLCATLLLQGYTFRTPLFFPAILLSAWLGGTGPGLLAVLLSTLSINVFILNPEPKLEFGLYDITHLAVFLFTALLVSSWSASRKRAERRLRDKEQRWHGLTEALPQLVWGATSDGACDYFSTQWTDYTGVPETELLGWQWMKVLHPDDREPTRKFWTDSVAGRTPYDVEYRVQRKDGVYGWFKTRGVPIRDEEGKIEKWFGTCTDITDRKQAEASLRQSEYELRKARDELESKVKERTADLSRSNEALRRNETHLAEAQRLSKTGSWVWNVKTKENVFWSREQFRIYGFDPETSSGQYGAARERVHPEDASAFDETLHRAVREQRDFEMDHRIVLPGGEVKHIHVVGHPVLNGSGELVEYIGTVMDITESKRAADAVRASEQVARGQVEALTQSLDVLATAPDPENFIGQMLSTMARLLNAQSVVLWLLDKSADSLLLRSAWEDENLPGPDPEHPFIKDPLMWKQNPVMQELIFTGAPVVCDDIETDPRVSGDWADYLKRKRTRRFLAVPMFIGGEVRGFVGIRHFHGGSYRPEEIELTQALAHQVMLALQLNEFAEQGHRAAVFEERNRMARDIHDTLAQGFTGVIVQLEAAEDAISCGRQKEADEHLHRVGELARRSLSEARRSVHALRPQALEDNNFWDALKGIIKNTTVGTALHTTFEARGKLPELPRSWQENLLHIGQEALTNTLKYAHAQNFRARLSCDGKGVRLELRDDGDGFKVKDRHDGVGLIGMRERVEQMGGELKVTSSSGGGTTIAVVLPSNGKSML